MFNNTQNVFFATLHPITICVLTGSLVGLALIINHPLYLAALLSVCLAILASAGVTKGFWKLLLFALPMWFMLTLINSVIGEAGASIIWESNSLPVLGSVMLTKESAYYSFSMILRILTVISAFLIYTVVLEPDRLFALLAGRMPLTAVVLLLAMRTYPTLLHDYLRLREAYYARNIGRELKSWRQKLSFQGLLLKGMLVTALERSSNLAESMHVRGFGSKQRTTYRTEVWRPRDTVIVFGAVLAVSMGIYMVSSKVVHLIYYPQLDSNLGAPGVLGLIFMAIMLLFPVWMQWGWHNWCWLRLRV